MNSYYIYSLFLIQKRCIQSFSFFLRCPYGIMVKIGGDLMEKLKFFVVIFLTLFIIGVSLQLLIFWIFGPLRMLYSVEYILISSTIGFGVICFLLTVHIFSDDKKEYSSQRGVLSVSFVHDKPSLRQQSKITLHSVSKTPLDS